MVSPLTSRLCGALATWDHQTAPRMAYRTSSMCSTTTSSCTSCPAGHRRDGQDPSRSHPKLACIECQPFRHSHRKAGENGHYQWQHERRRVRGDPHARRPARSAVAEQRARARRAQAHSRRTDRHRDGHAAAARGAASGGVARCSGRRGAAVRAERRAHGRQRCSASSAPASCDRAPSRDRRGAHMQCIVMARVPLPRDSLCSSCVCTAAAYRESSYC